MSTTIGQVPPRTRQPNTGPRRRRPQSRPRTRKLELNLFDVAVVEDFYFKSHTLPPALEGSNLRVADRCDFGGKELNSPNDVYVRSIDRHAADSLRGYSDARPLANSAAA